jgi:hypothetical protein
MLWLLWVYNEEGNSMNLNVLFLVMAMVIYAASAVTV